MKQTPEQRAEARYKERGWLSGTPYWVHDYDEQRADGYATCIREEVEPLEAEVERLRALVQGLVTALDWANDLALAQAIRHGMAYNIPGGMHIDHRNGLDRCKSILAAAKSQGFVPTNTTEG